MKICIVGAIAKGIEFLRTFPFICPKALPEHPLLSELIISFGANGYVELFEIEDSQTMTVLAIRHQCKKISFESRINYCRVEMLFELGPFYFLSYARSIMKP